MSKPIKFSLYPFIGLIDTNVKERAMGRILHAQPTLSVGAFHAASYGRGVGDLASDVFFSLYKAEPQMIDDPPVSRYLNAALIRLLHNASNFESLRANTIASVATALHSTGMVVSALMTDEAIKEAMQLQQRMERLQEQLKELMKQLAQAGGGDMQGSGDASNKPKQKQESPTSSQPQLGDQEQDEQDGEQKQPEPKPSGSRAKQRLQEEVKRVKSEMESVEKQMKRRVDSIEGNQLAQGMATSVIGEGQEGADQMRAMMTSWGIEDGTMSYLDANKLVDIATKKGDTLALVAELGGRVAGVSAETLQAVRDSYVGAPSEPAYTRDFLRMFPMERAYMSDLAPSFVRALKVSQWAQRGVLGLRPKSEGKKRGALVIAVDGSSSMDRHLCTVDGNSLDRSEVAKIVATGVARAMREDRFEQRRYTIFTFNTRVWDECIVTSASEWHEVIEWIKRDPNGGTLFDVALNYAIDELERYEMEGTLGADLLFITDGESDFGEDTHKRMKEYRDRTGARVFYIQIGGSIGYVDQEDLDRLMDVVDAHVRVRDSGDIDDMPAYLAQQVSAVFAQVG